MGFNSAFKGLNWLSTLKTFELFGLYFGVSSPAYGPAALGQPSREEPPVLLWHTLPEQ